MMTRAVQLSFLKVLAAVAWADGVVEADERNRIKILFNGFDLDEADRREIDSLLDRPVSHEQAVEITKEFAGRLAPPGVRRDLLAEIEALLGDEEGHAPEERELLAHVKAILQSHTVVDGLVEKFRGVFSGTLFARGRRESSHAGPLVDRTRNGALARVADRFRENGWTLDGRETEWNRATLVGVLLAHVVGVDGIIHAAEQAVLQRVLADRFGFDEATCAVVSAAMEEEARGDLDLQRICSESCRITAMGERIEVLEVLFEIAVADGLATKEEVEEIHRIADLLWISRPEYLEVRDRYRGRIEP